MRVSYLLWFSLTAVAPAPGQAGMFGTWNSNTEEEAKVEVFATADTTRNGSRTLHEMIHDERRFVLFNSRRLTGECIDVCPPTDTGTNAPTFAPTTTYFPTYFPTGMHSDEPTGSPTKSPTVSPTDEPTESPTKSPTNPPTDEPTKSPTKSPTNPPTDEPTESPTKFPTKSPTKPPTDEPTKFPTKSPTKPPTDEPTKSPTKSPTKPPTDEPTKYPTKSPTKPPTDEPTKPPTDSRIDCEKIENRNLGEGYSEATGSPHFEGQCYPPVVGLNANDIPGRDDSVAVFVGGNYIGRHAAEVEGNLVVLGNLSVESNGPGNFVSVGVGTHILPNSGGDCIIVGGNISASRDIQVFNQVAAMECNIVSVGPETQDDAHWKTRGDIKYNPNYDMSKYEDMKDVLKKKSQHWATLESTGEVDRLDWGNPTGQTTYTCSDNDDIQVFNIGANEHDKIVGVYAIYFSDSCEGKTILINVHGTGDIGIDAPDMFFQNKVGYGPGGFSTCLKESILWNFPDADNVDLGNGRTSEFQGSILVGGNLKMTTTGQSGRTMVLGDILHDRGGSEFHSYQFNPPYALPDPEDICELSDGSDNGARNGGEISSTRSPTAKPTPNPTPNPTTRNTKCVHIPQSDLPSGSWATNDSNCEQCQIGRRNGPVHWWPCNKNPSLCRGNCQFNI